VPIQNVKQPGRKPVSKIVITGLDPVIHLLEKILAKIDGCPDQVRA
jgi:hypothetical protein